VQLTAKASKAASAAAARDSESPGSSSVGCGGLSSTTRPTACGNIRAQPASAAAPSPTPIADSRGTPSAVRSASTSVLVALVRKVPRPPSSVMVHSCTTLRASSRRRASSWSPDPVRSASTIAARASVGAQSNRSAPAPRRSNPISRKRSSTPGWTCPASCTAASADASPAVSPSTSSGGRSAGAPGVATLSTFSETRPRPGCS
jgi:hypothetical protein